MKIRYIRNYLNGNNKNSSAHWSEIEVYDKNNVNVALNKNVTSNFESDTLSWVTNGDKNNLTDGGNGEKYVEIDLGSIVNVKAIKMFHYFLDNRIYKNNILQVSKDRINYETVFNSSVDGEYAETSEGKEITFPNFVDISITNQTDNEISFSTDSNKPISKVEVWVNNALSKTYTDNFANLTYVIDKSLFCIGTNNITIRLTTSDAYVKEEVLTYTYTVNNLSTSSSLKELIDRQEMLTNSIEIQKNNLKSILESKNVVVSEGENKLSILIQKVNELEDAIPTLYLYNKGDKCINTTGDWKGGRVYSDNPNTGSGVFESNRIKVVGTSYGNYGFVTNKQIDLSKYNKLIVDMEQEQETYLICAIFPSANIPIAISSLVASATMQGITGRKTLEIDISKINSGHIGVSSSNANGGYIYSIKLEV